MPACACVICGSYIFGYSDDGVCPRCAGVSPEIQQRIRAQHEGPQRVGTQQSAPEGVRAVF